MMSRLVSAAVGLFLITIAFVGAALWFAFRVYVPPDKCAIMIRKTGDTLPEGQLVATDANQRGIQQEVLGPGRHFFNPYDWDYEIKPLTMIPSGDPSTWQWVDARGTDRSGAPTAGKSTFRGEYPMVGVVTRKVGKKAGPGQVIVSRSSGVQGILEEVLTPGAYKINPYVFEVELHPAVVIPSGFVGVVTNLFGIEPPSDSAIKTVEDASSDRGDTPGVTPFVRPLAEVGTRGTLHDVLQPGVYFINPKLKKVMLVEIGFNEYTQTKVSEAENYRISFPSDTGYLIRVGVTVIWGIHPNHAAEIINEFGNVDRVLDKVIGPQLRSICRNIGSTYSARDFIQGEKRELFQRDLTAELRRVARDKNIEVLLALVREIEVHAPTAAPGASEVTDDLKRTIQQSYIAIESELTKNKQREAAAVKAQLEEEKKKVEIAQETIRADTRVKVANISAEGQKTAAETDAQASLEVATIRETAAQFTAQRTEILGQAGADVKRMKNEAEAEGYELLVGALGSPQAYNMFTFAQNFEPESIRLFYAGEGTFWTDLTRMQEASSATILKNQASRGKPD